MALDATIGGAASDSYDIVANATTYHAAMGNSAWAAAALADQESAMRRGTLWLDGAYRKRWPGTRVNGRSQAREWPRDDATDLEGSTIDPLTIPQEVIYAQFEAALVELVSPGTLSPAVSAATVVKSEKVGPLTTEYAVSETSGVDSQYPTLGVVERLLSGIVTNSYLYPAALVV